MRSSQASLTLAFVSAFSLSAAPLLPAAAAEPDAAAAYRTAYRLVLEERWGEASAALDELIRRHPQSDWADDAAFWRCYVAERQGARDADSFDCYDRLIGDRPASEWCDDARRNLHRLAQQLARSGHPEYRERARQRGSGGDDREQLLTVLAALGTIGDEESLDAIFERLEGTSDEVLRAEIVALLEGVEHPRAFARLRQVATSDPSARVRRSAVEALGDWETDEALAALAEIARDATQPVSVRSAAIESIGDGGWGEMVPLLAELGRSPDLRIAEAAISALGEIPGAAAFDALAGILSASPASSIRQEVVRRLGEREDAAALPLLRRLALDDKDPEVARDALEAIGELGGGRALAALQEFLAPKVPWRTRAAAVEAIADLETSEAVQALDRYVAAESDPRLRRSVAEALARDDLEGSVPVLARLARSDPDSGVRSAAVDALGSIASPAAREALIQLLRSPGGSR